MCASMLFRTVIKLSWAFFSFVSVSFSACFWSVISQLLALLPKKTPFSSYTGRQVWEIQRVRPPRSIIRNSSDSTGGTFFLWWICRETNSLSSGWIMFENSFSLTNDLNLGNEPKKPQMRSSVYLLVVPAGSEPALPAWGSEWERVPPDFIAFFDR